MQSNFEKTPNAGIMHVSVNDRIISVNKLGLIKYAEMSSSLKDLIVSILEIFQLQDTIASYKYDNKDNDTQDIKNSIASIICQLVDKNIKQVATFLNICIPELEIQYIYDKVGLDDVFVLIDAILRVNNINRVVEEGKKLMKNLLQNPSN